MKQSQSNPNRRRPAPNGGGMINAWAQGQNFNLTVRDGGLETGGFAPSSCFPDAPPPFLRPENPEASLIQRF
jgi:hypothetical protein